MEKNIKIGDKVKVNDPGLKVLQQFVPKGALPQDEGTVSEIWDDGTLLIEFPLHGSNHSQAVPYQPSLVEKINLIEEDVYIEFTADKETGQVRKSITDKKKIKNYLPFYLGCEVFHPSYPMWSFTLYAVSTSVQDIRVKLEVIIENEDGPYPDPGWCLPDHIQPLLYPLSSLKKPDLDFLVSVINESEPETIFDSWVKIGEQARYLLSKHFDLFGLIESGLAIDKTKQLAK